MTGPTIFTASVVVPVSAPPLEEGSVVTEGGVIVAVGERSEIVSKYPKASETRFTGVLTPGFVNAHTHLQFTGFAHIGSAEHKGFEQWSEVFDAEYAANGASQDWHRAAVAGAEMARATGTTTVADVSTDFHAAGAVSDVGLSGVVYLEVLGHTWKQWIGGIRDRFVEHFESARSLETARVRVGISPHAPYSLDTRVLEDLSQFSRERSARLHTHLAESAHEDEYCRFGTGPLADFVAGFGRDFQMLLDRGTGTGAAEFARSVGLLGPDSHVAHGIYLDAAGRALLRDQGTSVALCPRSNEVIGLESPPIAAYLEEGNEIAVGTDSLSSSPSLDLMEDVSLLYRLAIEQGYERDDLPQRLLLAATVGGAKAIGLSNEVGSLAPGRRADLAVFDVDAPASEAVERLVLAGGGHCTATVIGGSVTDRNVGPRV